MGMKTTFRLLAACAAASMLLLAMDWRANSYEHSVKNSKRLAPTRFKDVERVTLETGLGKRYVFSKRGENWEINTPIQAKASSSAIQRFLDAIEEAPANDFIADDEIANRALSYGDFGLDHPSGKITVVTKTASFGIDVGDMTPTGDGTYAKVDAVKGIVVTSPIIAELPAIPLEDFSDRRLCSANLRDVEVVVVERKGALPLRLKRSGNRHGWRIEAPESFPADWGKMTKFFDVLASAKIQSFVVDDAVGEQEAPADPLLSIKLFSGTTPFPSTLTITGKNVGSDSFAVMTDSGAKASVTGAVVRALSITGNDIRDRRVFISAPTLNVSAFAISPVGASPIKLDREEGGDWNLVAPSGRIAADPGKIASLIGEVLNLKAESYVTAPGVGETPSALGDVISGPSITIVSQATTNMLESFLAETNSGTTNMLMVVDGADFAAVVSGNLLTNLTAAIAGPESLASRKIAEIDPEKLVRIAIARRELPGEILFKGPEGEWLAAGGTNTNYAIDNDALDQILNAVKQIQARAVSGLFTADEAKPVFNPAIDTVLEIGLTYGTAPSQQLKLGMGGITPDGKAVYCTVDGGHALYEIGDDFFDLFNQDILTETEAPPPPINE